MADIDVSELIAGWVGVGSAPDCGIRDVECLKPDLRVIAVCKIQAFAEREIGQWCAGIADIRALERRSPQIEIRTVDQLPCGIAAVCKFII